MNKLASSKTVAGYQQSRSGKRPIRVHNLLKKKTGPIAQAIPKEASMIEKDPLVQYLKKVAADPTKGGISPSGLLESNEDNLPTRDPILPLTVMNPGPTPEMAGQARNPIQEYLKECFDEASPAVDRKKYTDKDRRLPKDLSSTPDPEEMNI